MAASARRDPADALWSAEERRILGRLDSTAAIQAFLDTVPYSTDPIYRSPRSVMRDRRAHCFDGALFAAAALRRLGHPPRLVNMRAVNDDDHVIALFELDRHYGAVATSNFVPIRYREPVFRTVRELVLSYFEFFFNIDGLKTMRAFSRPIDLRALDHLEWTVRDEAMEVIAQRLDSARHTQVLTPITERHLSLADERTRRGSMLGTNPAGLYKPPTTLREKR